MVTVCACALSQDALVKLGQHAEAEKVVRERLAALEARHGRSHRQVAACYASLGQLLRAQARYQDAVAAWERYVSILEATHGRVHSDLAAGLCQLAEIKSRLVQSVLPLPNSVLSRVF